MTMKQSLRNQVVIFEFLRAIKPDWVSALDILLVLELLTVTDESGQTQAGIEWLAQRVGASRSSVKRSLAALCHKNHQWLAKASGKPKYTTNTYTVQVNNLPLHHETKGSVISADAMTAAMYYHGQVKELPKITTRNGRKRSVRVQRGWEAHWGYTAQGWLDAGFDSEHIKAVIDRALLGMTAWKYCHGLHTLKTDFVKLLRLAGWSVTTEGGFLLTVK